MADCAKLAGSDATTPEALDSAGRRMAKDPRVVELVADYTRQESTLLEDLWRESMMSMQQILRDPKSTNLDRISTANLVGRAVGRFVDKKDIRKTLVVEFKGFQGIPDASAIEAMVAGDAPGLPGSTDSQSLSLPAQPIDGVVVARDGGQSKADPRHNAGTSLPQDPLQLEPPADPAGK
jgi:hypothetical protein